MLGSVGLVTIWYQDIISMIFAEGSKCNWKIVVQMVLFWLINFSVYFQLILFCDFLPCKLSLDILYKFLGSAHITICRIAKQNDNNTIQVILKMTSPWKQEWNESLLCLMWHNDAIWQFSFKKLPSAKWRSFCLGLNVLNCTLRD